MKRLIVLLIAFTLSVMAIANDEVGGVVAKSKEAKSIEQLEVKGLGVATIGMLVKHKIFGNGKIIDIAEFPDGTHTINVNFDNHGTKWLVPEYANLEPDN
ncbi:MAG: hypothetical protein ACI9T7_003394 [Oleiphilaceae bacterium]|jgi:hypothetical protein